MADYQSSYTGAQLDAAIASYANRTTGQIILTPDQLNGSLSDGYYSGVSASFDYSNLTAESSHVLSGKSAVGKYGKITNGGIANNGAGSITLDKDNLSKSIGGGYYSGVSASFDGTGLNAGAGDIRSGKYAVTSGGTTQGTLNVIDTSGDTVTAGAMLDSATAHDASGSLITGTLKDGIVGYYSNTYNFDSYTNFLDYVFNIGFVPNIVVLWITTSGFSSLQTYRRVIFSGYSKNVDAGTFLSEIYRGIYFYRDAESVSGPKIISYYDYNLKPYENGNVKGVIGVCGSSVNYKLYGAYRLIALKTTNDAISS